MTEIEGITAAVSFRVKILHWSDFVLTLLPYHQALQNKYETWNEGTRKFVSTYVFPLLQFVSNPQDLAFGSDVQEEVCSALGVPETMAESYWHEMGLACVEQSIRRKRSTIYNTLHQNFKRYAEKTYDVR
jgi:hypothetical protein